MLKIIAGLGGKYLSGEKVVFSPGYSVGYLAQEPLVGQHKNGNEVVKWKAFNPIVERPYGMTKKINPKFALA